MSSIDWVVMVLTIIGIPAFGLWRARASKTVDQYLLAGKTMPWYAMGLSIMATQASAITFIATTGQAYVDGMRFVQFYFGLPVAMVILSATAVPIFHKSGVYTAYEYLEKRFDAKTRALAAIIFLIQRGMAVGVSLCAPAIVLSVIFGWQDRITTLVIGALCVVYTTKGGIKAVTWTDVLQMSIIFAGLILGLVTVISLLPHGISFPDAVYLAGAIGKLNAVDLHFDPNNRYNLWSGLIGGSFLALGYFGGDQSQVQRYLTGKSIAQSRLGLLFNAMAKVPMQFFILFIGAMVFVVFMFEKPPVLFNPVQLERVSKTADFPALQARYDTAFDQRTRMLFVGVTQVAEGDVAEARQLGARADATRYVARSTVSLKRVGNVTGNSRCGERDLVGAIGDAVFREHRAERTKRGSFKCVDADFQEIFVHLGDEVGPRDGEQFVASFEVLAAEIVGREVFALHVGAKGAIEHDDALIDGLQIAQSFLRWHRHRKAKTSKVRWS